MNGQSRESENEDKNQHQMQHIRAIYRNLGTPVDTSLVWPLFSPTFCGSKPLISSRFIRLAETSISSFCLSTNGCRCCYNTRSLPQGGILTRLTGSDFLIQCIPAIILLKPHSVFSTFLLIPKYYQYKLNNKIFRFTTFKLFGTPYSSHFII